ncbi:MAG: Imm17 family immunity protein [Candidatus Moduliflexus flocculans]|nr:Imm17 family immunity protein [Candidatus Moduliflexus flocculans]
MNHPKARFFVKIPGRGGARIFYGVLGLALVVLGGLILYRVIL